VLPTVTDKAKYGLTSGLLPRQNAKGEWDIRKTLLATFPDAQYAGETQEGKLKTALADQSIRLCYWNMTAVDECYHTQTDPDAISNNVGSRLDALSQNISQMVMAAADPDRVAVVISTDHGQMLGPCVAREGKLKNTDVHGRMAKGDPLALDAGAGHAYVKAADGSAVLLNPTLFQLSEPTTLALKSYHFGEGPKDSQGRVWGVHGGLCPEEVVVGFSVLLRNHQRKPVMASVRGMGEVGKSGRMILQIDNPNPAPLRLVALTLNEIDEYQSAPTLSGDVEGLSQASIDLELRKFPSPISDKQLNVTGALCYEFSDGVRHECAVTGALVCKQMYSEQRPSLRDRFKK
jgi:hypothetical protein